MRLLALFIALVLIGTQSAHGSTGCPSSDFVVAFEPNSATLSAAARETVEAAYIRATQCDWPVFTLLSSVGDPIGLERAQVVQSELVALGLSVAIRFVIGVDEPAPDGSPPPDRVIVLIDYDD